MMRPADLKQHQVLVVGAGVTGVSVMRYLHRHGVHFDLAEQQPVSDECARYLRESRVLSQFDEALFSTYDVIVLSPGVPRAHPAIVAALRAGVTVIGDIELYASALQVPVIAVTGSNGKSTVVSWLAHVLEHCGVKAALCGNIGRPALDALDENASLHVLELSSYQLESTDSLAPLVACVLNVSDDHLDRYASMDHYAATKRRIYSLATHCVVNQDDERTWCETKSASGGSVRCFALQGVEGVDYHINGAAVEGTTSTDNITLYHDCTALLKAGSLSMPGLHNVANALAILAMLEPLSLQGNTVLNALRSFSGLPHRTELVADRQGVRWFNDSKGTNVDACIKAIQAMSGPVILIAGGQGKGANFQVLRPSVERHVKLLLLMGEDSAMLAAALSGLAPIHIVESLQAAVSLAARHARSGDNVLLSPACASFDMFRDFEDRGDRFRDSVEALAA